MLKKLLPFQIVVCLLFISGCSRYYVPSAASPVNYRIAPGEATADDPLNAIIAPYKTELDAKMNAVIGQVATRLYKEKPSSPLGNWVADALQIETQKLTDQPLDASVQNYGGLRIPELPVGPITLGKVYELMPFDNMQVIVEMSGTMVQRFFDHVAADGGWPVSKEVQFVLKGQRADRLTLNGKPIQPTATYRIALPDYIANGGGNCDFLIDLPRENTGHFVRDLLIQRVQNLTAEGKPLEVTPNEERIIIGD